jgi:hypothetical protein
VLLCGRKKGSPIVGRLAFPFIGQGKGPGYMREREKKKRRKRKTEEETALGCAAYLLL